MTKDLPNPELLRKLLRYEPDTGKLFWRERDVDMFSDGKHSAAHNCASWNSRYANREAFTAYFTNDYKHGCIFGSHYLAHRVIWAMMHDEWPDTIDHINGVPSDNRIKNLRSVSQSENCRNAKRPSNNKSGVCGVCWHKQKNKWAAQIKAGGKQKNLGYFDDFDDAVAARKKAEIKYGFHHNHGRD